MQKATIIHLADIPAGTRLRRRPGRPRQVAPARVEQAEYDAAVESARRAHVAADGLVRLDGRADLDAVLGLTIAGLAEETAALGFEAQRAESLGRDASQTRSRRIKGLLALAGAVRDREVLRRERGGLEPEAVAAVAQQFFAEVTEAAAETMSPEVAGAFMERVAAKVRRQDRG